MGLAYLAFRAALIAWSPHQRLLIFGKCVRPGLGFGLFPKFFMGHPTHALDSGILRQVVELTGEKLNSDKSITANSKVDIPTRPKNYKLRKFDYLLPKSPEAATPVAFFLDPETVQQFLGQMEGNGVTYNNLEAFRQNWPLESTVCRCQ